ncbi:MAG: hypothetical protein ACXWH7_11840 [Thermoanaerobaculia bacterium]
MARKTETKSPELGRLRRAANAVKRVFTRNRADEIAEPVSAAAAQPQRAQRSEPRIARPARIETDIPLDLLEHAYIPPVTSSKASFRSDGADHQEDQDFQRGIADDRWQNEDHYTNKSGDPRIGTRGRTYEANETREESREQR